ARDPWRPGPAVDDQGADIAGGGALMRLPFALECSDPAGTRRHRSRRPRRGRVGPAATIALVLSVAVPALAPAHPLGNFTINHFAAIRVGGDTVALDVVIDRAEIPAFQERQRLDSNGDGTLQPAELAGQDAAGCTALAGDLRLAIGGDRAAL